MTIIATPAQYYKFNGWAGDASGSSDHLTITMDSDKTIVASFTKLTYSVQTQVDASGGGTIDPGSGAFEAGTYVNITATPASGYRFDHWGGSATGSSNPVNILIDTNKTVTAYFIQPTRLEDVNFYIVGTWQGVVDTPWVPDYHCQITFNDNLTYSVKSVDSTPVLYYGDDADSACKTYRVTDMNDDGTATGEIAITWDYTNDCGDTSLDQLRRISFSNGYNTLHFEFWHFDHYGPVVFDLTRVP